MGFHKRTQLTILAQLSKASFVEGDFSLFKWKTSPFPKRDSTEIAKIILPSLIILSRTPWPNSIEFGTRHPWVKEIQGFINKEHLIL